MWHSETCPILLDPKPPGYNHCLTHPCQSYLFLISVIKRIANRSFLDFLFFALRNVIYSTYLLFLPRYHKCLIHYRTNKCCTRRYWGVFYSSSLNAFSFVGRPLLMTSLSLAFHLLRFSSPQIYLLSGNMCIHKYAKWTLYNMKKFWWQPYSLFRRDRIVNIFLSCVQYPRLTMICSILSSCCHQTFLWLGAISDEEFGHFYA